MSSLTGGPGLPPYSAGVRASLRHWYKQAGVTCRQSSQLQQISRLREISNVPPRAVQTRRVERSALTWRCLLVVWPLCRLDKPNYRLPEEAWSFRANSPRYLCISHVLQRVSVRYECRSQAWVESKRTLVVKPDWHDLPYKVVKGSRCNPMADWHWLRLPQQSKVARSSGWTEVAMGGQGKWVSSHNHPPSMNHVRYF